MKYKILKSYIRKYALENEIPIVTVVVKFKTETGYIGKLELPSALTNKGWVEKAIKKDIENAKRICDKKIQDTRHKTQDSENEPVTKARVIKSEVS